MQKKVIIIANLFPAVILISLGAIHIYYITNGIEFPFVGLYWWPITFFTVVLSQKIAVRFMYIVSLLLLVVGAVMTPALSSWGFLILMICAIRELTSIK